MLPAPGQGAIAVVCRLEDELLLEMLHAIANPVSQQCVAAERGLLMAMGGGCSFPLGAMATLTNTGAIELHARVVEPDASRTLEGHGIGDDPTSVANLVAQQLQHNNESQTPSIASHVLSGKRIAVTRPAEHNQTSMQYVRQQGGIAIAMPCIVTRAVPDNPNDQRIFGHVSGSTRDPFYQQQFGTFLFRSLCGGKRYADGGVAERLVDRCCRRRYGSNAA